MPIVKSRLSSTADLCPNLESRRMLHGMGEGNHSDEMAAAPEALGNANLDAAEMWGGTVFVDGDIITEDDPSTFVSAQYAGTENRETYDNRAEGWVTEEAHLVDLTFSDGLTSQAVVNVEFGGEGEAMAIAEEYGAKVGQLPTGLRTGVNELWIHRGDQNWGGGNNSILIHTDYRGIDATEVEEILFHEAAHSSLDPFYQTDADWVAAQQADGAFISEYAADYPQREDIAESVLMWYGARHRADRMDAADVDYIESTIPNRLAFFDNLDVDMSPIGGGTAGPSVPDESVSDESVSDESVSDESVSDESVSDESVSDETSLEIAGLTTPSDGSTFDSGDITFSWSTPEGTEWYDWTLGSSPGNNDYFFTDATSESSAYVTGLPTDGRTIYGRLWTWVNDDWDYVDYEFTAAS